MKNRDAFCYASSIVLSGVIAYLDASTKSDDAAMVIIALWILAGGVLGAMGTFKPWRWALIVALGVPAIHLLRQVLGLPDNMHPNTYLTILLIGGVALCASLAGAYSGALVRSTLSGQAV